MANWRRWARNGVLITVSVTLVAIFLRAGAIEADLSQRALAELSLSGQSWAQIRVSGRDATVAGVAPSPESVATALSAVGGVAGVREVHDRTSLLPIASPFLWSARRVGKVVTLIGNIPSESMRNSVLAAARRSLPDAEIHDETILARGAPPAFNAATGFALTRLAGLSDGTVTLTDSTLAVTGIAANSASYSEGRAAFRDKVPASIALGPVDILPARAEPFVWSAALDAGALKFSGYVPNEIVHESLLATARATFAHAEISDETAIASGEPEGFAEAATFAISALGRFTKGGVTLDSLNLDISGTAKTVDDYEAVEAGLASDLPPGVKIVANAILPATVAPYTFAGEVAGDSVTLTGYVPTPEARDELIQAGQAVLAGRKITNKVRIAAGEPKMDWMGAIKFSLAALSKLKDGRVDLGDKTFGIEGEARTPEAFAELLTINSRTLPASLEMTRDEVTPPTIAPYVFAVSRGPGSVVLTGYAPSAKDRTALVTLAARRFAPDRVVDNLGYAGGQPPGFSAAIDEALQALTRVAAGTATLSDRKITIEGDAYSAAASDEIRSAIDENKPEGFDLDVSISARQEGQPVPVARCRDLLQDQLKRGRIEFDGQKAEISADSYGLLDRVAATLARCRDAQLEIGAHSDSSGSSSKNRDLTQARAEAIVDYLVDAGIERELLTPVGYGETKPIADNGTAGGRAQNRRIEFTMRIPEPVPAATETPPAETAPPADATPAAPVAPVPAVGAGVVPPPAATPSPAVPAATAGDTVVETPAVGVEVPSGQ
ncbi:MAG TPA: OmpA family protein [Bauldia sp.]|nr:OmpA family protein [Bauldia sp.]